MSAKPFKPGDRVVWWKQTPGVGYVFPVLSTVLAVTEKRVKIEAEDEEGKVIRHVQHKSIEHHVPSSKPEKSPATKSAAGKSRKPGKEAVTGQKLAPEPLVVWSLGSKRPEKDEAREDRIVMEIVVDAYDESERAMGWYYYLQEKMNVPFRARCIEVREVSPLSEGDEVEVVDMPSELECEREMFISIRWGKRTLAVPLAQLQPVDAADATMEAVEDWHYWLAMGHGF